MRFGHSSHLVFIPTFCAESAYDTQVELACCISQLSAIPCEALARGFVTTFVHTLVDLLLQPLQCFRGPSN